MAGLLSALLSFLFSSFARFFLIIQTHFTATKIVIVTVFMLLFPVVLNNLFYDILEVFLFKAMQYAQSQEIGGLGSVYSFTGLAGYLLGKFKIPESFSVVISAIAVSFTLRTIPFVRW